MSIAVTKIQSYSVHDGPGIRTTVFLKGCTLHCPWCANPETQSCENALWFDEKLCAGTDDVCSFGLECSKDRAKQYVLNNKELGFACPTGALKHTSMEYKAEELLKRIMKDAPFIKAAGGVTFSGGEPLLQISGLEPVLEDLQDIGIDICFETALNIPAENVQLALKYADRFFVDMKSIVSEDYKMIGGNVESYRKNIRLVDESAIPYIIRIPLVKPYTYNSENLNAIAERLLELNPQQVEVFQCHNLGSNKYSMLGRQYEPCNNVSEEEVLQAKEILSQSGKNIRILKLG